MLERLFCCVAESHCLQQCFHHLDTGHRCRKDICMKAAQTNMVESEHDAERGNCKQEKDQPRRKEELVPNRGANSAVRTWCGWKVWHGPENHTFKIWKQMIKCMLYMWSFIVICIIIWMWNYLRQGTEIQEFAIASLRLRAKKYPD